MNNEALDMAYNFAIEGGYRQSKADFIKLLATDYEALNMSYEAAKKGGYSDSIEDFSILIGNKNLPEKKNPNVTVTESPFEDGSSDSQETEKSPTQRLQDLQGELQRGIPIGIQKGGDQTVSEEDLKRITSPSETDRENLKSSLENQAASLADVDRGKQEDPQRSTVEGASQDSPFVPTEKAEEDKDEAEKTQDFTDNLQEMYRDEENREKYEKARKEELEIENTKKKNAHNELLFNNIDFQKDIITIDNDLIKQKERELVDFLTEKFGKYGFIFEPTGTERVIVRTLDGLNEITIKVGDSSNPETSDTLRQFVAQYSINPDERENSLVVEDFVSQAVRAQQSRDLGRQNGDGSISTHLMAYAEEDGRWVAFPTLFPTNPDIQSSWPDRWTEFEDDEWENALALAKERGEVYYFDDEEQAANFAEGAWKHVDSPEILGQEFYEEQGLDYFAEQEMFDNYVDVRADIGFLENQLYYNHPFSNLTEEEQEEYAEYYNEDGELQRDIAEQDLQTLQEQREELQDIVMSSEREDLRDAFDLKLQRVSEQKAQQAVKINEEAKQFIDELQVVSLQQFGVPLQELEDIVPKTEKEAELLYSLATQAQIAAHTEQFAANKYELSKTFFDRKNDKHIMAEYVTGIKALRESIRNGWYMGKAGNILIQLQLGLKDADDKEVQESLASYLSQRRPEQSKFLYRYMRAQKGEAKQYVLGESGINLPLAIANGITLMAESMSQMLPYGMWIIPTTTALGGGMGAGVGSLGGGVGALPGALIGAAKGFHTGMGLSGFVLEFTNSIMDAMRQEGYDLTNPDDVAKAFNDKEVWEQGRNTGLKRGIPIGIVDAFTSGLAGRLFKTSALASKGRKVTAQIGERMGFDPIGEMAGEGLAQIVAGQEIDGKEIFLEGWGGIGNNTSGMAVNLLVDQVNFSNTKLANSLVDFNFMAKESATNERIVQWATNMRNLGKISAEQEQEILTNVGFKREAIELLGKNASPALVARTMELLSARADMSRTSNLKQINSKIISEVNSEISKIVSTGELVKDGIDVGSALDTRAKVTKQSSYSIDGKQYSRESFLKKLNKLSDKQLVESEILVSNDTEVETLKNDKKNAVQKSKTESVDVGEQTTDGSTVGEGDTQGEVTQEESVTTEQEAAPELADPIKATKLDKIKYADGTLDDKRKDGLLVEIINKQMKGKRLTPFQTQLANENQQRLSELESDIQGAIDLEKTLTEDTAPKVDVKTEGTGKKKTLYTGSPKSFNKLGDRTGLVFLSTSKDEANEYANNNRGKVMDIEIDENSIASEKVLLDIMKELGIDTSQGLTYELIDPRFKDFYIGKANVNKVISQLKKRGFKAAEYTDGSQLKAGTVQSVVVFDKSAISEKGKKGKKGTEDSNRKVRLMKSTIDQLPPVKKQIVNQAKNIVKALEATFPDVKVVIHTDEKTYSKHDANKNKGTFDDKTNTIHINLTKADNTTVAHEAFHAVLLNSIKTDKETTIITNKMLKAADKLIGSNLKRVLNKFAESYDTDIQSEEQLAQLIGVLASNYDTLSKPEKNIILQWLKELGQKLGFSMDFINQLTRNEEAVIDLLNTLSTKFAKGETIVKEDLQVLHKMSPKKLNFKQFLKRQNRNQQETVAAQAFNLDELEVISKGGTGRIVYQHPTDKNKVIKVATGPRGLEQNLSVGFGDGQILGGKIAELFERGLDYIVVEKVPRNDKVVNQFLKPLKKFSPMDFRRMESELVEQMEQMGLDDFRNYNLLWNDFIAGRNWGVKDGSVVLVDEGALNDRVYYGSEIAGWAKQEWEDVKRKRREQPKRLDRFQKDISPAYSIVDIVNTGRMQGISDVSIKMVLKGRGFDIKEINEALKIQVDDNVTLPTEFTNIEGGALDGFRLFNEIKNKLNKFAYTTGKGKRKALRVKTYAEVRAEAQRLLRESPVFKKQNEDTQMAMELALDRSLGIRTNPTIQKEISAIRNILKAKKLAVKDIKALQNQLRALIRKTLPKSSSYSQAQINSLLKRITDLTPENYIQKTEEVLNIVDKQKDKIKTELIKKIEKLVKKKASVTITKGGRRVTKGLDAIGQDFFRAVKNILKISQIKDLEERNFKIEQLKKEISPENILKTLEITETELINKALSNPENLSPAEQRMLHKLQAYDTVGDLTTATMEEVEAKLKVLEEARSESIGRLQLKRLERAMRAEKLSKEATEQIREVYPDLFEQNEDGDWVAKNPNELSQRAKEIREMYRGTNLIKGVKSILKRLKLSSVIGIRDFFQDKLLHLHSLVELLDREGKRFFTNNIYKPLRKMEQNHIAGVQKINKKLDEIANSIPGITRGYKQIRQKLYIGNQNLTINGKKVSLDGDQLLRIYTLSKNEVQRKKLERQGFTPEKIEEIKKLLGPQAIEFADKTVEFLSNEYFEGINSIYKQANDTSLGYVENYFPTRTISRTQSRKSVLEEGDFGLIFSDNTHSALKERTDKTGDVFLGDGFTDTLAHHIDSMEHYKSYALGVKDLTAIVNTPAVKALFDSSGLGYAVKRAINFAINPQSLNRTKLGVMEKTQSWFTSWALAFKAMQIPKQASSFINAFEDYYRFTSRKEGQTTKQKLKNLALQPLELISFMGDFAYVMLTFPKQFKKAMQMSPRFKKRWEQGMEGDLYGLTGGGLQAQESRKDITKREDRIGEILRWIRKGMSSPTIIGDVMGIMGYMANYNRNIREGMSPEQALEAFEEYELTQQTRSGTEKIPLQMQSDAITRSFTMFGSTLFLQINKVYVGFAKMLRGETDAKAIKSIVLNAGLANVLFIAMANMFKFSKGDEKDKEEVLKQMRRAMMGMNLLSQIPLFGGALEHTILKMSGENPRMETVVNPYNRMFNDLWKFYSSDDLTGWQRTKKMIETVLELRIGFQLDTFFNPATDVLKGEVDEETFYDLLGVSPSYRPGSSKKKGRKKSKGKKSNTGRRGGVKRSKK